MINYLRYNQQTVESIGKGLGTYKNASELAKTLNVDVSIPICFITRIVFSLITDDSFLSNIKDSNY